VLLACSRDDLIVHPSHTARLAETMPAARRLPPFVGGHGFFQHDGTALANAVLAFLAEVEATHPPPPERGGDALD
jgi:pimeloyl-ACP methyl ester carboxylesterase